ncbi:MAG: mechanosensitive ion channel family protein [Deltaproteobacteria bacterium]|nr:MAG: mechanosensitive ion channel family protein [Deltaproteobacteria bacterium]
MWMPVFLGAATKKVVRTKGDALVQQFDSLLLTIVKWLNLPPSASPLVEWCLRLTMVVFVLLFVSVLARRAQLERIVGWVDDKVGAIELTPSDRNFVSFAAWAGMWLIGLIMILYILKLHTLLTTVGLSAGVVTALVAASNRDLLGNVSAGFALQARRHITQGHSIKVMGLEGTLKEIGLTSCTLEGWDGVCHYIPNAKLLNEVLTNYSLSAFRRATITFWFDQDEVDLDEVESVLNGVIAEAPGQSSAKTSFFTYGECTEKGQQINLYVYFDPTGWSANASATRRLLLEKIDASEIRMGIPQQLVLFVDGEAGLESDETVV